MLLEILLALVVLDYVSGVAAAAAEGSLSSKKGFRALPKKLLIFVMVAVAHMVDRMVGGENTIVMDATCFFYAANELLSIIENAGRAGLPVPAILKSAVEVFQKKTGGDSNG